ncbi:MAG: NAD(P)H-hydrate dehydratase [Candidatus Omnitrophica bacterium]|nr:NAD(P)H-hydrate dehydratase [Candidatus Omnitrophota bacterium]
MRLPARLLQRKAQTHKGDYGHLFILAGSARFSGAGLLCAEAALRSGAGLVTLGLPKSINLAAIKIKPKEVMTLPLPETKEGTLGLNAFTRIFQMLRQADVLVIGPGLGNNKSTYALIRRVINKCPVPAVIDADGLNALSSNLGILMKHKGVTILTPHQKELSRLFGLDITRVQKDRKLIAKKYAKYYNNTIVLKGHETLVAGSGGELYVNKTGNPGMATAGSGDVLSGMIGAFLTQGLEAFSAAKYAVYLHGLAGDIAAKDKTQMGMIASDIIDRIPEAIKRCS